MQEIAGWVAFITGGSRGIGKAIALKLANEGVHICVTARNQESLDQVVKECEEKGVKAIGITADATNSEQVIEALDKCIEVFGKLSILVNNGISFLVGYILRKKN